MGIETSTFAQLYSHLIQRLQNNPTNISCRNLNICYELTDIELKWNSNQTISIYSSILSRCIPIKFILAEFLWIISGTNDGHSIARFNSRMMQYSDDKIVLNGAYGFRLRGQLENVIQRLLEDKHTRQAVVVIYHPEDALKKSKDIPCNTMIQFLIRNDILSMRVISRSSDFVTGLSIDGIHWQFLLHLIYEELKKQYSMLQLGYIVYHIGSLHVYDIDKPIIKHWKLVDNYETKIHNRFSYYDFKNRVKDMFDKADTLQDIMNIYNFSFYEQECLRDLNKYFLNQRSEFKPMR